jgi:hypothetical protein
MTHRPLAAGWVCSDPENCIFDHKYLNSSDTSDDDLLREKMKELFPYTEYDQAERGRYYSQKDN